MSSAWKDLERRVCRRLGTQRRHSIGPYGWAQGSDDDGSGPFAVECKRTTRYQLRRSWIEQARLNGKTDIRPWLLVIAEHNDRRPIAVLDFETLATLLDVLVGRATPPATEEEPCPTAPESTYPASASSSSQSSSSSPSSGAGTSAPERG